MTEEKDQPKKQEDLKIEANETSNERKVVQEAEVVEESKAKTDDFKQKVELAKLDNFHNVGDMLGFAEVLLRSRLLPDAFTSPEKVIVAMQQGRELGLGAVASLNNIHVIEGRPALSVHAIGALLRRVGVAYQTIRNYEPEYEIDSLTGDLVLYNPNKKDANGKPVKATKEEGGRPRRVDIVTSIKFFRRWEDRVIEEVVDFRWSEAQAQNLVEKSNWVKMPRIMMWNRCLAIGGRRVAPDALLGMLEISEVADMTGITIDLDEQGNPLKK